MVVVKVVRENEKRGEFKGPKEVYIGFTFRVSILERDFFEDVKRETHGTWRLSLTDAREQHDNRDRL